MADSGNQGLRKRGSNADKHPQAEGVEAVATISASTVQPARRLSRTGSSSKLRIRRVSQPNGPTTWFQCEEKPPPLVLVPQINVLLWLLVGVGSALRFWRLDHPRHIVFDEVHFGKFASYYLQSSFFFDVHPPLGKLVFAGIGWAAGYDGSFLFPTIGIEFPYSVPYVAMRAASALAGSLLIPCVYHIMLKLGFSHRAALLAGFFITFDNALVVQSRVIMLDSFVLLFTSLSLLCFLEFYHQRGQGFSPSWHAWLAGTGMALGLLLGVKYSGLFGMAFIGILTVCDLWQLLADKAVDAADLGLHVLLRATYLLGIPLLMNIGFFYLHFLLLTNAGPGNAFVSQPFRNSLQGSVETPLVELSANATLLRYGSNFTLRSSDVSCWLHSHDHLYPLKYPDGRGSSYQQQVTCYDFRDPNNMWSVHRPGDSEDPSVVGRDAGVIRNKDVVELVHISSGKVLNSHDVAAPLSPTLQEVAGYINYSSSFVPYLQWTISVVGLEDGDPIYWEAGKFKMRLNHVFSKQALACTGKRLPDWGFQQYEVVTDKAVDGSQTIWLMEDLQAVETDNETSEEAKNEWLTRKQAKLRPQTPPSSHASSFLEKYFEIQQHMLTAHGTLGDHTFSTTPYNWPLLSKILPYWLDESSNCQVTLMGNPLLWWAGTAAIPLFILLATVYILAKRRLVLLVPPDELSALVVNGCVLIGCWLIHYLPYHLLSRVLFLHHYLPALPCKLMLLAATIDHAHSWAVRGPVWVRPLYIGAVATLCLAVMWCFAIFVPFTYGYPSLTAEQIKWRHWVETWDLLYHVNTS